MNANDQTLTMHRSLVERRPVYTGGSDEGTVSPHEMVKMLKTLERKHGPATMAQLSFSAQRRADGTVDVQVREKTAAGRARSRAPFSAAMGSSLSAARPPRGDLAEKFLIQELAENKIARDAVGARERRR